MKPVGIIANPASGKDIRRLVACGSVFDSQEKINIIRRVLLGLDAMGVEEAFMMPDDYGLGRCALEDLRLSLRASLLRLRPRGIQEDSTEAARMLREMGVGCIVTLGGDGTNRVTAKACGDVPLVPISTGTNNVFPYMVEGTLAGLAAGILALGLMEDHPLCFRSPRLELRRGEGLVDIALVDVVVAEAGCLATRAVWEVDTVREIFLSRSRPSNIGFSSVGGCLCPLPPDSGKGLHIRVGKGPCRVKAPIAPGLVRWVPIASHRPFGPDERIPIARVPSAIALDGEREISVRKGENLAVSIHPNGPLVVNIERALECACRLGLFRGVQE